MIKGLAEADRVPGVKVFHAGTVLDGDRVRTDGGRVLGVTALGDTLAQARDRAYQAVAQIDFPGMFYRKDIAARALPPASPPPASPPPESLDQPPFTN